MSQQTNTTEHLPSSGKKKPRDLIENNKIITNSSIHYYLKAYKKHSKVLYLHFVTSLNDCFPLIFSVFPTKHKHGT